MWLAIPEPTAPVSADEKAIPSALPGMTAVTGLVDANSFLSLGRVFTANMTGNILRLAFACIGVIECSILDGGSGAQLV